MEQKTKKCPKCGWTFSLTSEYFYPLNKQSFDRYSAYCKPCQKLYSEEYRQQNKNVLQRYFLKTKIKRNNRCIDCSRLISPTKNVKRCHSCANRQTMTGKKRPRMKVKVGKDSWNWKGGKPKCLDCGKELCHYKPRNKSGRCATCYYKFARGKNSPNAKWFGVPLPRCTVCNKEMGRYTKTFLCTNCRTRERNPNWKGGQFQTKNGYVWILCPAHPKAQRRYVKRAILIMEKHLGRYLTEKEIVHHKGKKDDDRIEMLKLFPNTQAHMRYHYSIGNALFKANKKRKEKKRRRKI